MQANEVYGLQQPQTGYGGAPIVSNKRISSKKRHSYDIFMILICIILPIALFSASFSIMAFGSSLSTGVRILLVAILLLPIVFTGYRAWKNRKGITVHKSRFSWLLLVFSTSFIFWGVGIGIGYFAYANYWYDWSVYDAMTSYSDIQPATASSIEVLDGAVVSFSNKSRVDSAYGMLYYYIDDYCAAPIVSVLPMNKYPFWAVGKNCCSGSGAGTEYTCADSITGAYDLNNSFGGLRVLSGTDYDYYSLTIKQAESKFGISAGVDPVMLELSNDPTSSEDSYKTVGLEVFYYSLLGVILVQIVITTLAARVLSRM